MARSRLSRCRRREDIRAWRAKHLAAQRMLPAERCSMMFEHGRSRLATQPRGAPLESGWLVRALNPL